MRLGWIIALAALGFIPAGAQAGDLWVAEYACARQIVERMPVQQVDCLAFDLPGPVYLWVRLRGEASALDRLAAGQEIVIRHKWTRFVGPNPQIETIQAQEDIRAGAIDSALLTKLRTEIERRGFFDWRTWTAKSRVRPTRYSIEILDPAFKRVPCRLTDDETGDCGVEVTVRGRS